MLGQDSQSNASGPPLCSALRLGLRQTELEVQSEHLRQTCERLMQEKPNTTWPTAPSQLGDFARAITSAFARTLQLPVSPPSYNVTASARKVLHLLETPALLGEACFDKMRMDVLLQSAPDVNQNTAPLASWQAGDVRKAFALSPLSISSWCCYFGSLTPRQLQLWERADDSELLRLASEHHVAGIAGDLVGPSAASIARVLDKCARPPRVLSR